MQITLVDFPFLLLMLQDDVPLQMRHVGFACLQLDSFATAVVSLQ
jgi:hypothetical protein